MQFTTSLTSQTNLAFSFVIMGKKLNILCVMVRKSDLEQSCTSDRAKGGIWDTGNKFVFRVNLALLLIQIVCKYNEVLE